MLTPVFEDWRGRPVDDVIAIARNLLEDVDFPTVRRWREAGGKVLGHFQVYFPEELAHAAGMLPVKVHGAAVEGRHAEARFGSYLCSIVKSSLELALSKRLELDIFVSHPICDVARNLAAIWERNVTYPCRILYLPQNANSSYSAQYLRDEYARVQALIEEVAGRRVRDEDLRASLHVFNENRRLLRELYAIKRDTPWLVSVDEAYALMAIGGRIPREEHNALLASVLPAIQSRAVRPQDRMRVVFELLRAIGQSVYVVDDDLLIGLRWIVADVDGSGDAMLNLATAYLEQSTYSPVQHDLRKPKEKMLLERIRASRAEAAIITSAKMCEPGLDEQVAYVHALDEAGIPYFVGEFEEKMTSFDHFQIQLETFVENVLFA